MTTYSRFATLINGVERDVDLSVNTLNVGALEVSGTLLSQAGTYAAYSGTPTGGTAVVITATNPGTGGNSIVITLTGSNTVAGAIATWNTANPSNTASLTSGSGSQTPSAQALDLSGGTSAGSTLIGDTAMYTNITPTSATVAGVLMGINNALAYAGTAITSLTGDATATGPGAAALTLATVNSNTGSWGTAADVGTFTVNAKGLITAASNTPIQIAQSQVTGLTGTYLPLAGGTMSGNIAMGGNKVTGLAAGSTTGDALEYGQIGVANGVAGLDGSGKVPLSQLPSALMEFQGNWNPNTNTPTLVDGTGTTGFTYWVSAVDTGTVAGLNDPSMVNFQVGDLVIYNGTAWVLTTPAAGVSSVNGAQGNVMMTMATANGFAGTYTGTALTVSTTITGLLKGNGTAISAATAGTDYVIPSGSITGTAGNITATTNSTLTTLSSLSLPGSQVTGNISGDAANVTGTVAIANGGTGQTTAAAAYNALSPMTTTGDLEYEVSTGIAARLPIGTTGQVLTVVSGAPAWAAAPTATSAPVITASVIAGQTFTANTTYVVRWGMNSNSETTDRVYAADQDTSSKDFFWVIGVVWSATTVTAGNPIMLTSLGSYTLGSSDTAFLSTDPGLPVWLTSSGAFSTTAPTTAGYACSKVGMVQSTTQIWVGPQMMGVN